MRILPGIRSTVFPSEGAQLEGPRRKTSEEHCHKPAVTTDQGEHGPCLHGVEKTLNCLESHLLLPLREMRRLRTDRATSRLQGKTHL